MNKNEKEPVLGEFMIRLLNGMRRIAKHALHNNRRLGLEKREILRHENFSPWADRGGRDRDRGRDSGRSQELRCREKEMQSELSMEQTDGDQTKKEVSRPEETFSSLEEICTPVDDAGNLGIVTLAS